jgi:hypothetical protein
MTTLGWDGGEVTVQAKPECRAPGNGRWGAVIERDGTMILIESAPKFSGVTASEDTNPFSSRDAILELVGMLQPLR